MLGSYLSLFSSTVQIPPLLISILYCTLRHYLRMIIIWKECVVCYNLIVLKATSCTYQSTWICQPLKKRKNRFVFEKWVYCTIKLPSKTHHSLFILTIHSPVNRKCHAIKSSNSRNILFIILIFYYYRISYSNVNQKVSF